ncbi:MAG: substrate-binding periplasmic protein [Coriobacteriales bacterium]|jgi:polar amino acid transport system substrate-binding protein
MRKTRFLGIAVSVMLVICACFCMVGCNRTTGTKEVTLTQSIDDSALVTPGKLTVGVDSSLAPFGGDSDGQIVGLDVDVAAALADEMGVELQVVDTSGQNAVNLLTNGQIDVVMSMPTTLSANSNVALVGEYVNNGPALYGKSDSSNSLSSLDDLNGVKVGAYSGSTAALNVVDYCGSSNLVAFSSLSDAFDALESGQVEYVASDSVAGGYLSMTYSDIVYVAALDDPTGVYMGVLSSNTELSNALTTSLQTISSNGVLQTIASKWVGKSTAEYVLPTGSPSAVTSTDNSSSSDSSSTSSSDSSSSTSTSDSSSSTSDTSSDQTSQ